MLIFSAVHYVVCVRLRVIRGPVNTFVSNPQSL
jgi:hypothetical protein